MAERFLVFGDIHGEWRKLENLLARVKPDYERDEIVFLGDYVDRGPEPKRVLDYMMSLPQRENIHLLQGNHESMMWDGYEDYGTVFCETGSLMDSGGILLWMQNGGHTTFQQVSESEDEFRKYADFVHQLPLYYGTQIAGRHYLFCHAGIDPACPFGRQTKSDFIWNRHMAERYTRHRKIRYVKALQQDGELTVVVGHTPVLTMEEGRYTPIITPEVIFLDTGSFLPEGRISCIDLISGRIWQSQ